MTPRVLRRSAACLLVLGTSGFLVAAARGADQPPQPPRPSVTPQAPHGPSVLPKGRERDITDPGETEKITVWRDGRYVTVDVPVRRKVVTETITGPDGKPREANTEVVEVDESPVNETTSTTPKP